MYIPPASRDDDIESIRATIRAARLASLVTATSEGPVATPLPLFLDENEGEHGVLYEHVAKANPQWKRPPIGDALAIFSGPDAYVTPSWYATSRRPRRSCRPGITSPCTPMAQRRPRLKLAPPGADGIRTRWSGPAQPPAFVPTCAAE